MYVSPAIEVIRGTAVSQSNPIFGEDDNPTEYRNSRDLAAMAYEPVRAAQQVEKRASRPVSLMLDGFDFGFPEESVVDEFGQQDGGGWDAQPETTSMDGFGDSGSSMDGFGDDSQSESIAPLSTLPTGSVDAEDPASVE